MMQMLFKKHRMLHEKHKVLMMELLEKRRMTLIWAKLPQSLVLRGGGKGWRKITKRCKDFLIGRTPKIRENTQGKKQKITVIEQLVVSNSTVLNQELNWGSTDWNKEAELIKSLLSQTNKCND